ncbi:protein adenylyltransferase SelO [Bacillus sp. 2205SS5-2]|uniref:protein adenylyltransferase SelO n=1 Tax=Bacillus sp. 2205SS5-2 TaxID=3109031 RepID=UPI0030070A2F
MKNTNKAGWKFDHSYSRLPESFYSKTTPNPVTSPELVVLNEPVAKMLGLDVKFLRSEEGINVFAGNKLPEGAFPLAQAYAGHQFGHINMLGDGRAVLLGEQVTTNNKRMDIQLKGSGRTPYSRGGDGRASLGPMLREFIISEGMHALGIPTTRSLAVVSTGEFIRRETALPGAVLTRVASSHLRVGTFQFVAQSGSVEELKKLADYALKRHFSGFEEAENRYLFLLQEVIKRQANLIAKWQLVGFIHGVMNTDNMTISGETIDYGPCAFMDSYDQGTVFSSIDREGRYAYGNQPYIGAWNIARFAETLIPLLHSEQEKAVEIAQQELSGYTDLYKRQWVNGMRTKLGIFNEESEDQTLIEDLLKIMQQQEADFTNTFRAFTQDQLDNTALIKATAFVKWQQRWQERLSRQSQSKHASQQLMMKNNPIVVPRNHRVEEALTAAVEDRDFGVMEKLLDVLSKPYEYSPEKEKYCSAPPSSSIPYQTYCGT